MVSLFGRGFESHQLHPGFSLDVYGVMPCTFNDFFIFSLLVPVRCCPLFAQTFLLNVIAVWGIEQKGK